MMKNQKTLNIEERINKNLFKKVNVFLSRRFPISKEEKHQKKTVGRYAETSKMSIKIFQNIEIFSFLFFWVFIFGTTLDLYSSFFDNEAARVVMIYLTVVPILILAIPLAVYFAFFLTTLIIRLLGKKELLSYYFYLSKLMNPELSVYSYKIDYNLKKTNFVVSVIFILFFVIQSALVYLAALIY